MLAPPVSLLHVLHMSGTGMQQVAGLNLSQSTILAPQMQQSLQILQAPTLELRALVQQELEANPVLEEVPPDASDDRQGEEDDFAEEFERLVELDDEWRDHLAQSNSAISRSSEDDERRQFFFDSIPVEETLQQHLIDQLNLSDSHSELMKMAELIIGNIDDAGYLQGSIEDLSNATGVPLDQLSEALSLVQGFHPPGVGARNLRECLLLQLERSERTATTEYRIIADHLDELARHRYPDIARRLGLRIDQIQTAAGNIAMLDPRPGHLFSPAPQRYVLPDVTIERIGEEFVIQINNEQIPHLRISKTYKDLMAAKTAENRVGDYIRDKIRGGKFLIKSIHQRQETIFNIAREILERQREFFEKGPAMLKPLTMVQVAEAVGVHETTVSRAISGKFVDTPYGLFEMRYFFTSGYKTADGTDMSNTSVKEALAELVRGEDPLTPLSDKEIVDLLSAKGVDIARRTVAKYRGELNILPSNLRRRF